MYRNFILLTLFVMAFSFQELSSQNNLALRVTYKKEIILSIDTAKVDKYKNEVSKLNRMISKNSGNLEYELIINDFESSFEEKKSLSTTRNNEVFKKLAGNFGGTRGFFYTNNKDSVYINKREYGGQSFNVTMKLKNWVITSENKKIGKYICYKATSRDTVVNPKGVFKYDVVAWFCPELPNSFGPSKYFGLPGLILELDNGRIKLLASNIVFTEPIKTKIKFQKNGISMTSDEFNEFVNKTGKDLLIESFKN